MTQYILVSNEYKGVKDFISICFLPLHRIRRYFFPPETGTDSKSTRNWTMKNYISNYFSSCENQANCSVLFACVFDSHQSGSFKKFCYFG